MTSLQVFGTVLAFAICLTPSVLLIAFRRQVVESIRRKAERNGKRNPSLKAVYQLVADGQSTVMIVVVAILWAVGLSSSLLIATMAAIR